jgi:hypothetical protein
MFLGFLVMGFGAAGVAALFAVWREMYLLRVNRDILFPRRKRRGRRRVL